MASARQLSKWGIASLVLLLGEFAVAKYNLYLYDHGRKMLWSFATDAQLCVVVQLAAVACGVIAMKRQSPWWALTVVPAVVLALSCFFGEL